MSEETEVKKDLFYRKADKFLLKIGDDGNNYFNPDASGDNNNWNWLKKFAENVVEEISANRRQNTLESDERHLEEIKYYINRYIFEVNDDYTIEYKDNSYIIVYDYLKDILQNQFLIKIDKNKNKINIEDVDSTLQNTIDKFSKQDIIKNIKEQSQSIDKSTESVDDISVNKNNLVSLNDELNEFNYNYKKEEKNNFIDINFKDNNYIYAGKDKDIKLLNIYNDTYQDIVKNKNIKQDLNSALPDLSGKEGKSINRKLKDLILSIKNRYNIIQKQVEEINVYQGYITRGVFFYYKNILDELVKKLKDNDEISVQDYKFLPISISIMIYDIIFKHIYNNMNDEEVIEFKNLNEGQNDMSKFATLFYVEMKPFLDQYKACDSTQKVKFFCNINDNEGALDKYEVGKLWQCI